MKDAKIQGRDLVELKASKLAESSESIIMSFDSRWINALVSQQVHTVFRKRGPQKIQINEIFVYLGSPVSSIVGVLPVEVHQVLPIEKCLPLSDSGAISTTELISYSGKYNNLHVFKVGPYEEVSELFSLSELKSKYRFYPPQSFLILSVDGRNDLTHNLFKKKN